MPINELEQHPYLNYYQEFKGETNPIYYTGIIIGSFPIFAITDSIDPATDQIIEERSGDEASMRFFYGSKKSDLWKYVGLAFAAADPRKNGADVFLYSEIAIKNCKRLLFENHLLMSDALFRTNRVSKSSEDTNLMADSESQVVAEKRSCNYDLFEQLKDNKGIKSIYFTASSVTGKSPCGWFRDIFLNQILIKSEFVVGGRIWSAIATIDFGNKDFRKYNLFFLPTPKPRGIHWNTSRTVMFENFVRTEAADFYMEIDPIPVNLHNNLQRDRLSVLRIEFLVACYQQAIVGNNLNYDGTNPMNY